MGHGELFGSVAALSGGSISTSLLGALGGLLVARFLGPEETGLFRVFTLPIMYLTFLQLGTFDGIGRQIPFYAGTDRQDKAEAAASVAGAWNAGVSGLASFVFLVFAFMALFRNDFIALAGWTSQAVLCWNVYYGGYLNATYRATHQFVAMARIQFLQAAMGFGLVFILPFTGIYGLCIRAALPAMAGIWLYHRFRPLKVPLRLGRAALEEVVGMGLPYSFWNALYTTVWMATESVLIFWLGGAGGLGLFAVASVLREGMLIVPQAVNQAMTPRVVAAYARDGSVRLAYAGSLPFAIGLAVVMVPLVLLGSSLLPHLVPLAIPRYVDGIPIMKVCLWFSVIKAGSLPLNTLFATGRSWPYGRGVLAGLVVFPVSACLLGPYLGGTLAVVTGSLLGRLARTLAAYAEIARMMRQEARDAASTGK